MALKIALAGNPNSGKTTLFNALTGSSQFVGNWPGVTVEKKEGRLKGHKDVAVIDLPGIYSLSPYSLEEVIARNYLLDEKPDCVLNIIDASNLERNLFLTTQLLELGIPTAAVLNMMDAVEKSGDVIDRAELEKRLACPVLAVSALKGAGIDGLIAKALELAEQGTPPAPPTAFSPAIEEALAGISSLLDQVPPKDRRFYSIKLLEKDEKFAEKRRLPNADQFIAEAERKLNDDTESAVAEERYRFIDSIISRVLQKHHQDHGTLSDRIDAVVTNRWLALPIFACVIFIIYFVSVSTVGAWVTDWTNDCLFGEGWYIGSGAEYYAAALEEGGNPRPEDYGIWIPGVPVLIGSWLEAAGTAPWLNGLILDGIVAGCGAVLGFVPQMLVLFMFLAALEACGYMARIAFILDRLFRRFGLSGRSFISMLIGTGCGIPGVMASRTIENEKDRRMTIITATFMPCGAKLPIIALIAGAVMDGAWWVAPSAYFLGIASVVVSGIMLKKTPIFAGGTSPFVMELPPYRPPTAANILLSMWERGSSFVKKAGTVILLSAVLIWFLSSFGFTERGFAMVEDLDNGLLARLGGAIAWVFAPLGFGTWDAVVAAITGLIAKENVVGTMGVLYGFAEVGETGEEIWTAFSSRFTPLSGYAFLAFNLYCPPCFAAIGAIRREMNNAKWTAFAVGYQLLYGYTAALIIYQLGRFAGGGGFGLGTAAGVAALGLILFLLFRKPKARV
jgi:ferrous iron transport protein B